MRRFFLSRQVVDDVRAFPAEDGANRGSAVANARTVMIVEDNLIEREGLAAVLRQEGYGIVLAANGKEALERLQAGLPRT
jgi:response regulator RpfG family c-di-GMP phosphodiesterase